MKIIDNVPSQRFSNAYHVSYFQNFKITVDKYGTEQLGLDAVVYQRFTDNLATEQDIVNRARASEITRALSLDDYDRDNYFRSIWYKLRAAMFQCKSATITDEIRETIKSAFDRDRVGSTRATADAVNEKTFLRWNWTACSTIENGKDFFSGKMITDGAVSRINFCTIIPPTTKERYCILPYDKQWRDKLAPYIKNLNNFRCEKDEDGNVIPYYIPEAHDLEEYLDNLTTERNAELPDDVYEDYGRRARVMTIKEMITLYIAHGCQWLPEFDDFAKYLFDYAMWAKLALFYEKASSAFKEETITFRGHWSPLKEMKKHFTLAEFTVVCQKYKDRIKQTPIRILTKYKTRGVIYQVGDDTYTISDAFCKKHNIK